MSDLADAEMGYGLESMAGLYIQWRIRQGKFSSLPEEVQYSGPVIDRTVRIRKQAARKSVIDPHALAEKGRVERSRIASGSGRGAKRMRMSTSEAAAGSASDSSSPGAVSGRYREDTEDSVDAVDGLALGNDDSDEDWRA